MALPSDAQYVGWGLPAEMTSSDGVPHITISGALFGGTITDVPQVIALECGAATGSLSVSFGTEEQTVAQVRAFLAKLGEVVVSDITMFDSNGEGHWILDVSAIIKNPKSLTPIKTDGGWATRLYTGYLWVGAETATESFLQVSGHQRGFENGVVETSPIHVQRLKYEASPGFWGIPNLKRFVRHTASGSWVVRSPTAPVVNQPVPEPPTTDYQPKPVPTGLKLVANTSTIHPIGGLMSNGMTIAQMYAKVYTGTPQKILKLRTSKETTGRKIGFHPMGSRPELRTDWVTKLMAVPNRNTTELVESMKPRPLFLTPGRNGRACLLVGHATWNAQDSGVIRPANLPGFREWFRRDGATSAELNMFPVGTASNPRPDELQWRYGSDAVLIDNLGAGSPYDNAAVKAKVLEVWSRLELCQGARIMFSVTQGGPLTTKAVIIRAVGHIEPGYRYVGQDSYVGGVVEFDFFDYDLLTADSNFLTTANKLTFPTALDAWHVKEKAVTTEGLGHWRCMVRLKESVSAEINAIFQDRMTSSCGEVATALGVSTFSVGSYFPLPMVSQQIGWVTGFGNDHGPVMIEVASLAESGDTIDIVTEWASLDVRRVDFLRLFPASTLPEEKRAGVEQQLLALPANIWFRSILFGKGLNYPEDVDYTTTQLAKDIARVGSTLDELLFDALEENGPAVSYESLGARSLVSISKGKHAYVALVLASDDATFVSQLPIVFQGPSGSIRAVQNGNNLDSGQAFVAMKTGATYSFSNVTQDQVAIEFFKMASWSALTATLSESPVSRSYIVDENQNSNDGRFNLGPDESARAIPLLLGFSRHEFSVITGSLVLGVTKPEI